MEKERGFTMIELMITIVVIGIALSLAVPGFSSFIRENRATSQANELLVGLTFARSEAIKRGRPVAICASNDSTSANPTCTGNNDWTVGWISFTDDPSAGGTAGDYDAGTDSLLRVHEALGGSTLTATTSNLRFDGDGIALTNGDFTLNPNGCEGNQQRSIDVSATGSAKVSAEACP